MNDAEIESIDKMVAETVMGWHSEQNEVFGGVVTFWFDSEGSAQARDGWQPSTEISDAWQVVERMRELGWAFSMHAYKTVHVTFSTDVYGPRPQRVVTYEDDSLPKAIVFAALAALGASVEGEPGA